MQYSQHNGKKILTKKLKTDKMKQTAVESIIKFCEQMANQDLNSHRGAYFNVIKFCKDQAKEMEKQQQGYSLDDLKEAFAMGRTNATIKDFNQRFKKK